MAANSSPANKTGSWRTYKPLIDKTACIGCSLCYKICPEGCIKMKKSSPGKNIAVIDYDYCKGCGLCVRECPVKAISREKDY